jgi:alkylation response protein AidB-like acyl-CoA dehydrogenase
MQAMRLAGMTSLAKFQATRTAEMIADESVQIFGGRGITKSGMGKYIERFILCTMGCLLSIVYCKLTSTSTSLNTFVN